MCTSTYIFYYTRMSVYKSKLMNLEMLDCGQKHGMLTNVFDGSSCQNRGFFTLTCQGSEWK